MKVIGLIKRHALISAAILVLVLIAGNTIIAIINNYALKRMNRVTAQVNAALFETDQIWSQVVRNVDIGMRGYALLKQDSLSTPAIRDTLFKPSLMGERDLSRIIKHLREITEDQHFPHPHAIDSIAKADGDFIKTAMKMKAMAETGDMAGFYAELRKDPGKGTWAIHSKNADTIKRFENNLNDEVIKSYERSNVVNTIFQILLGAIGLPTLAYMVYKINNDRKARKSLFLKLEENNREFLFNPGTDVKRINENEVIDNSIANFKTATEFISQVSNGNFSVQWNGITPENEKLNTKNLAGELIQMRDRMKTIKAQDEIRNWTTEGLAKYSDVIRQNQDNIQNLSYDVLVFITKYMNAQQGCLFVVSEDLEDNHTYLEMTACYAFNRKKHMTKRIEIGQGIIGQVYLEGQPVLLTDVPNGYTEITSGLGESTPTCVLVIPMTYNEKVEAVIEIAGFEKYEKYQIEFMEKIGEITASTLGSVKNTEKMQHLVNQFKSQTEQLRAQEEELRQNMEEMEATQEALRRQDREEGRAY